MMKPAMLIPVAVVLSLATSACVVRARPVRGPVVIVASAPPPVRVESVPPPPPDAPRAYVWQPGFWSWGGSSYEWVPGHYERRPAARAVWVPAAWVSRRGQWEYRPGHWSYR